MKKRVIVFHRKLPAPELARLEAECAVTHFEQVNQANRTEFIAAIHQAHGMIGASVKLDDTMFAGATDLEAIATISVGYDNYDVAGLTRRGIVLTNTPDVLTESTADTIFSLVLATARRIVELAEFVKAGHWQRSIGEAQFGTDVHGKTLGILGLGRIGSAVARRGHLGFGMPILYHNRSRNLETEAQCAARYCSREELLRESDFVCVVLPLTAETENSIGAAEFAQMKPGAFFINGSRGKIVDEPALIEALEKEQIRGAGLDVFVREPLPADSPLLRFPNVVALPHIGSATHETRYAMAQCAVTNLLDALAGRRPPDAVNPEARAW